MKKCKKCGAKWRINFPFGRKSKGRATFVRNHSKECIHHKNNKKKYGNKRQRFIKFKGWKKFR